MTDISFTGYFPGLIGKIIETHGRYYAAHWGLDISFEIQVGRELSEFMEGYRPERDLALAALVRDEFAGAVAIDGREAKAHGARLRWFIVDPRHHGRGLGRSLLSQAVEFCRLKGYPGVHLMTYQGLEAARRLYVREGFTLTRETSQVQWGRPMLYQRFDLRLEPE